VNRVFKTSVLVITCIALWSCGSKKSPTGGPVDNERPKIVASLPEEFGDITQGSVELTFSKPIDKSSIASGIYIYPPVSRKKVSYDANTITIRIQEELKQDTNYFVTITTRLKDIRGNAFEQNQTIIYRSGRLNDHSISGSISYEDQKDIGLPVTLNVHAIDSLWVASKVLTGNQYRFGNLNESPHLIRAYIDKDNNGRYDFSKEPYFEAVTEMSKLQLIDINLAYADTTKPTLKAARATNHKEVEILFSESLSAIKNIGIVRLRDNSVLNVIQRKIIGSRLVLATAEQDTSRYQIIVEGLTDQKGNSTRSAGIQFNGSSKIDDQVPIVTSTLPRNGTSVPELRPQLMIYFSKFILKQHLKIQLVTADTKESIPVLIDAIEADNFAITPKNDLQNYRSYKLIVTKETLDVSGIGLEKDFELNFIPLFRAK